ncbi:uncharacterized protein LOC127707601 isoform X2 [Mytilus californianus]|uniref:uncharacterized protein LOC127707601 isoform X2 n=1 Tax=Mytilus californianus TaxID=6549 RepID=UPI0022467E5A|nr:uncharacterized protein LOC127707601 isoform X2 [Mytilus californianus]
MICVFTTVILSIIVYRYANGDQLNLVANDRQLQWTEAFGSCDDPTYWHQIFNDCQPESCNVSSVADTIINKPRFGSQQYWIYGYVLRSPVIVNIGCYSLNASVKNDFNRGVFSFEYNSAFECLMACPDKSVDFIFLRGRECLCIPEKKFNKQLYKLLLQENTGTCNQSCAGNSEDLCGGASVVNGNDLYSVFKVITRRISATKVGNTCAQLEFDDKMQHRFSYTTCSSKRMYICERYNMSDQSYKDKCPNETASWYAAQQNCQEMGLQLRTYTTTSFSSLCSQSEQMFWIGNHVAEKIVWANDSLPKDALCMKLVISATGSSFETENCRNQLHSLCYAQEQTSSGKNDEAYITSVSTQAKGSTGSTTYGSSINTKSDLDEENTNIFGLPTLRSPMNAKSDEDNTTNIVPIVAGSVGGFVAILIVVIIVLIVKRRTKSNNKHVITTVDQGQPETYSEPIKNTILEESRKLVNVTEEGIYNHLGDSENMIEMKPQDSSIYDVTGDDEYHVFTASGKQQKFKDDDDLYDHGASSDVYNTLNDTVTTNRPESDTYNVINTK